MPFPIPLDVAHLLTPHVNLGDSGTLLLPKSKWLSGFTTVLCCTCQIEPADTSHGARSKLTPAKASLPLPGIEHGSLSPKADTLPLHNPSPLLFNWFHCPPPPSNHVHRPTYVARMPTTSRIYRCDEKSFVSLSVSLFCNNAYSEE
jgi:hypothetical protein